MIAKGGMFGRRTENDVTALRPEALPQDSGYSEQTAEGEENSMAAVAPDRDTGKIKASSKCLKIKEKPFSDRDSRGLFLHFLFAPAFRSPPGTFASERLTWQASPIAAHPLQTFHGRTWFRRPN